MTRETDDADRWANRRAMAWISVVASLLFPALLLVTESDQLGAIAGPFYIFTSAVVGAYVGFATLDDRWERDRYSSYGRQGLRHDPTDY